jgi:hypothetical protein
VPRDSYSHDTPTTSLCVSDRMAGLFCQQSAPTQTPQKPQFTPMFIFRRTAPEISKAVTAAASLGRIGVVTIHYAAVRTKPTTSGSGGACTSVAAPKPALSEPDLNCPSWGVKWLTPHACRRRAKAWATHLMYTHLWSLRELIWFSICNATAKLERSGSLSSRCTCSGITT